MSTTIGWNSTGSHGLWKMYPNKTETQEILNTCLIIEIPSSCSVVLCIIVDVDTDIVLNWYNFPFGIKKSNLFYFSRLTIFTHIYEEVLGIADFFFLCKASKETEHLKKMSTMNYQDWHCPESFAGNDYLKSGTHECHWFLFSLPRSSFVILFHLWLLCQYDLRHFPCALLSVIQSNLYRPFRAMHAHVITLLLAF